MNSLQAVLAERAVKPLVQDNKNSKNGPKGQKYITMLSLGSWRFCVAGNLVTLYIFINTTTYLSENDHYN